MLTDRDSKLLPVGVVRPKPLLRLMLRVLQTSLYQRNIVCCNFQRVSAVSRRFLNIYFLSSVCLKSFLNRSIIDVSTAYLHKGVTRLLSTRILLYVSSHELGLLCGTSLQHNSDEGAPVALYVNYSNHSPICVIYITKVPCRIAGKLNLFSPHSGRISV